VAKPRVADADARIAKYGPASHKFIGDTWHPQTDGSGWIEVAHRFGKMRVRKVKSVPAHAKPVQGE